MPSIVLAEPSAPVAGALRRYLEAAGHEVSWVSSVDEALRTVRERAPTILMASGTGTLDGEALCRSVRAEGLSAPVLLLYSPDEEHADTRAAQVGADGCLVGPLKRPTVLTCVSLLVQREEALRRAGGVSSRPPPPPFNVDGPPPLPGVLDGRRGPPPPPLDDVDAPAGSAEALAVPPPPPLDDVDAPVVQGVAAPEDERAQSLVTPSSVVPPPLPVKRGAESASLPPELDEEPITSPSSEAGSTAHEAGASLAQGSTADDETPASGSAALVAERTGQDAATQAPDEDDLPLLHAEPEADEPSGAVTSSEAQAMQAEAALASTGTRPEPTPAQAAQAEVGAAEASSAVAPAANAQPSAPAAVPGTPARSARSPSRRVARGRTVAASAAPTCRRSAPLRTSSSSSG
ncbi:hypothetical protein ACLEPN_18465 [Myxococcus sp. 1LA]